MRIFRKVLFWLSIVADTYLLYSAIGYLVLGIQSPKILGDTPTNFMGFYIMSITFSVLFIIATLAIIFITRAVIKKTRK